MAIITDVPGLEVSIEVDGKSLKEHDVPRDSKDYQCPNLHSGTIHGKIKRRLRRIDHGYMANYIEIKSGTFPCIRFTKRHANFKRQCHHIAIEVQFDSEVLNLFHEPKEVRKEDWIADTDRVLERGTDGAWKSRKFRFADLNIVDADERTAAKLESDAVRGKDCGNIRVQVYHMKKSNIDKTVDYRYQATPESSTISETALKGQGVSYHVEFEAPEEASAPEPDFEDVYADNKERPFAVFDFKYRSKDALIRMGILAKEDREADMSPEELRAVIRDLRAKDKARERMEDIKREVAIKNEPNTDLPPSPVSIKREAAPIEGRSQFKVRRLDNGKELIYLTKD